jgi:hypothetical protein
MARRLLRLGRSKSVVRRCTAAPPRSSILPIGATAREAVEARDKDFVGKSPCDFAYHIMLHSEPPPEFSSQLDEAIQAGYPTLKIFTTNILPSRIRDHLGGCQRVISRSEAQSRRNRHPLADRQSLNESVHKYGIASRTSAKAAWSGLEQTTHRWLKLLLTSSSLTTGRNQRRYALHRREPDGTG